MSEAFASRISHYRSRIDAVLEDVLPPVTAEPQILHQAMRYSVFNGGKRIRPLLAYASAECLDVDPDRVDAPAAAVELIHAFSLVHDDLPAMDDDDLRRGQPTVHRKFGEATAILAGDALLPLAFHTIANAVQLRGQHSAALVHLISEASGSLGMTGGQAFDLAAEGHTLSATEMETLHRMKTGALIHAAIMCASCVDDDIDDGQRTNLDRYARSIGLAFQIRDDMLDVEGDTDVLGKPAGSDQRNGKATWVASFGLQAAQLRCDELLSDALDSLAGFGAAGEPLRWLADYIVARDR